jgi:hypothetical protein
MTTEVTKEVEKMDKVVEAVARKQGNIKDGQFASKLGISRIMWRYLKEGKRQPGKKFYSAVMREYPELIPIVLLAMTEKDAG